MADQQWEYETIDVRTAPTNDDRQATQDLVTELGNQGWELVAVRNVAETTVPSGYQLFFKRPKAKRIFGKRYTRLC